MDIATAISSCGGSCVINLKSSSTIVLSDVTITDDIVFRTGTATCGNPVAQVDGANRATLTGNGAGGLGGPIVTGANTVIKFEDVIFELYQNLAGSTTTGNGGALAVGFDSTVTLDNVLVTRGTATLGGGAHVLADGILVLENGTRFHDNIAQRGGAVYLDPLAELDAACSSDSSCTFSENRATPFEGGAVFASFASEVDIQHSTLNDNQAKTGGGALFAEGADEPDSTVYLGSNVFESNFTDDGPGGAIYIGGQFTITGQVGRPTIFRYNEARDIANSWNAKGGAAYFEDAEGSILLDVRMTENSSTKTGGAIQIGGDPTDKSDIYALNLNVKSNEAIWGGGIYVDSESTTDEIELVDGRIWHNTAEDGAGIFMRQGSLVIRGLPDGDNGCVSCSTIWLNVADELGGAAYLDDGHLLIDRTWVQLNRADSNDHAFHVNGGTLDLATTVVSDHSDAVLGQRVASVVGGELNLDFTTLTRNSVDETIHYEIGSTGTIDNSIVWSGNFFNDDPSAIVATCSNVQAVTGAMVGHSANPPGFRGAPNDLELDTSLVAPLADAVDRCPSGIDADGDGFIDSDIEGDARPVDSFPAPRNNNFDRGAFEGP
ncbi:MAG: hypothetical protein KTR31_09090 [Myxococcales bacterium]|nr:hypothetical protein [Myxococcales bacterium]